MIPPARYDVPLIRVLLTDSSGNPVTGIANSDANLRIAVCRDSGGSVAVFSGASILSIATIGTYSDPGSSTQCRWGEVDGTYFPGLYELQFNQAFWASSRASIVVRVYDASGTPRWVQVYAAVPCFMPVRVDHVRDTLQTARDLGAQLDATVSSRSTLTAADVWGHATRTLTSFGTLVSDVASAVWSAGARTLTSFGTLVSDVWSAATRTLTSYADSSGVTTLLSRLTSQRATNLDNLDATVSSRLAASAYIAPDNASVSAIKAKTDQLQFTAGKVQATLPSGEVVTLASASVDAVRNAVFGYLMGTTTFEKVVEVMASVLGGKLSGPAPGASGTVTIKSYKDGATDVVTATVDSNGNRTSVTWHV